MTLLGTGSGSCTGAMNSSGGLGIDTCFNWPFWPCSDACGGVLGLPYHPQARAIFVYCQNVCCPSVSPLNWITVEHSFDFDLE